MIEHDTLVASPADLKTGIDGKLYVVFPNSYEREKYMEQDTMRRYEGKPIASFGQFENAFCIE